MLYNRGEHKLQIYKKNIYVKLFDAHQIFSFF